MASECPYNGRHDGVPGSPVRAVAFRDGDFLRLISLHPDHDSAYEP